MLKLFNPELFQGSLKKNRYFEGWYFKHVSNDLSKVYSFIPGISLTSDDPHAFIQFIDGVTGYTRYLTYPVKDFKWERDRLYLKVGKSVFSDTHIELNIEDPELKISGELQYSNITRYPKSILSPGIMGWYSFVPFMECKHGVVSVNHDITGTLKVNDQSSDFSHGKGYIEKDWGTSFPEAWIWVQSNNFKDNKSSLTFSVAKIPWLGRYFTGFICFLYFNNRFYLFSTYAKSTLSGISYDGITLNLTLANKDNTLKITAIKRKSGELMAPASGKMTRRIKESIDSTVIITLFDKSGSIIYSDSAQRAGLEIIDKIFDYL